MESSSHSIIDPIECSSATAVQFEQSNSFTFVRRKEAINPNDTFESLRKTLSDEDRKSASKPKVNKFFKSRFSAIPSVDRSNIGNESANIDDPYATPSHPGLSLFSEFDLPTPKNRRQSVAKKSITLKSKTKRNTITFVDDDDDDHRNQSNKDALKSDLPRSNAIKSASKQIKNAHQCHDLGEAEQFDKDVEYYISGIRFTNHRSTRCLSVLALARQTMRSEFRMHLRAYDDMPRIIGSLSDSAQDPNLALCVASLMFVYHYHDRLAIDIDSGALSLLLDLIKIEDSNDSNEEAKSQIRKYQKVVISLVETIQYDPHIGDGNNSLASIHLRAADINAKNLAMETLMRFTARRADHWLATQLYRTKGIDFIIDFAIHQSTSADLRHRRILLRKIDRAMRALQNLTSFEDDSNEIQQYLAEYGGGKFIQTCARFMDDCRDYIMMNEQDLRQEHIAVSISTVRVLTHLLSESADRCAIAASFSPELLPILLESIFDLPQFIESSDQRFAYTLRLLCLCVYLVDFCPRLRALIIAENEDEHASSSSSPSRQYMRRLIEFWRIETRNTDQAEHRLERMRHETIQVINDRIEATRTMKMQRSQRLIDQSSIHMRHSLIGASVCLLFGCSIAENAAAASTLRRALPTDSFDPLIESLGQLRAFAHLVKVMTPKGKDRVQRVLQILQMYQ